MPGKAGDEFRSPFEEGSLDVIKKVRRTGRAIEVPDEAQSPFQPGVAEGGRRQVLIVKRFEICEHCPRPRLETLYPQSLVQQIR
jgi:hypothetical protein